MNAYTGGLPPSDADVPVLPSWSVSGNAGTLAPGRPPRPAPPFVSPAPPSSPLIASDAPMTAAAAQTVSAMRTSRRRAGTPPRLSLGQSAPDRVAHELDAIAHAELAQQVGPVRLD